MNLETSDPGAPGQTNDHGRKRLDDVSGLALRKFLEHTVATVFIVPETALRTKTRGCADVAFARQVAMYLAHVSCSISLSEVGCIFARDRTTVAHACRMVEDYRDNRDFDLALDLLDCALRASFARD